MGELAINHYAGLNYRFQLKQHQNGTKECQDGSEKVKRYSFQTALQAYQEGNYREALRVLKIKDENKLKDVGYYVLWGNTLFQLDMKRESLEYYRWALKLNPGNAELRSHINMIESQLGE